MSHGEANNSTPKGHEPLAVRVGAIGWFLAIFVVGVVVIHVLILMLYHGIEAADQHPDAVTSALAGERQPPPEPRLQPSQKSHESLPKQDMDAMRQHDIEEFKRRGWWDEQANTVHIPQFVASQVIDQSKTDAAKGANR